jgi:DnaJ family protein A protein 2
MSSQKNLYDLLGVKKTDSCNEIKKAYLKLARTHHPDKGGDPERFKEIAHASEVLTDEKRRKLYDDLGITDEKQAADVQPGPGFSFPFEVNLNEFFGNMFGGAMPGMQRGPIRKNKKPNPSVQMIPITLEQFYIGHQFNININRQSFCATCDHTGAKHKEICKACNGQGSVSQVVQVGPMTMQTTGPCMECQAKGERMIEQCGKCSGTGFLNETRNLSVKIIPGTRAQESYIFPEVCSDHPAFERPGDAQIILVEDPNDPAFRIFKRSGDQQQHLETTIRLSLAESLIGCVIRLDDHPGYDEGLFIRIPAGSFHGDNYVLSSFGMPLPGHIGKYGDLILHVEVNVQSSERRLFSSNAAMLQPLFKESIRKTDCTEEMIQSDVVLQS